jgi:fatty acid-binding protein DegV
MLRIVTDGAGDIIPSWGKEYGIEVIPVNILFGEKSYLQGVELDNEGFYKLVEESRRIPKTSQPSPHQFVEFYRKHRTKRRHDPFDPHHGKTIRHIRFLYRRRRRSQGRVQSDPDRLGAWIAGHRHPLPRSAEDGTRRQKYRRDREIRIEDVKKRSRVILTLDTLEYAKMSGRVKTLQAALASVLNVKPIAVLRDGDLKMEERVRTRKAALDRVVEMAKNEYGDQSVILAVVHARDPKSGRRVAGRGEEAFQLHRSADGRVGYFNCRQPRAGHCRFDHHSRRLTVRLAMRQARTL